MRVFYRAVPPQRFPGELTYEQAGPTRFCCRGICERWGALVGFGVPGCERTASREVNLSVPVPQADGRPVVGLVPVEFCPWCGEAVETCRVK